MSKTYKHVASSNDNHHKYLKKYSFNKIRASEREFCTKSKYNDDVPLQCNIFQSRSLNEKYLHCYWKPIRRWLNSHIGDCWDQVYSELLAKLKTGLNKDYYKELHTYIHYMVDVTPKVDNSLSYFVLSFYVDKDGLLQKKQNRSSKVKTPKFNVKELCNWLNGRVVGKINNKLFWFIPSRDDYFIKWKCIWNEHWLLDCLEYSFLVEEKYWVYKEECFEYKKIWKDCSLYGSGNLYLGLKRGRKFSSDEEAYWNRLPKYYQNKVLKWSPNK